MKKFIRVLGITILISSFVTGITSAAPSTVNSLTNKKNQAQKEVNSLQKELTSIMKKLNDLESKMVATGEAIIQATEDLEEAEIKEVEQYESMKSRIKAMYENNNTSMLTMIFEAGSFADMIRLADDVQTMQKYDRKALQEYIDNKEKIAMLKDNLEEDMQNMESMQDTYASQETYLNDMIAKKKKEVADFDNQLKIAAKKAAEEAAKKQVYTYTGTGDVTVGQKIVATARTQLGVKYVWGGTSPNKGLDCSGLTQYCHKVVGISIPRVSGDQRLHGKSIGSDPKNALPGDVICYQGHVGIYIGNNQMIHAPQTGDVVKVASVFRNKPILDIRRYW